MKTKLQLLFLFMIIHVTANAQSEFRYKIDADLRFALLEPLFDNLPLQKGFTAVRDTLLNAERFKVIKSEDDNFYEAVVIRDLPDSIRIKTEQDTILSYPLPHFQYSEKRIALGNVGNLLFVGQKIEGISWEAEKCENFDEDICHLHYVLEGYSNYHTLRNTTNRVGNQRISQDDESMYCIRTHGVYSNIRDTIAPMNFRLTEFYQFKDRAEARTAAANYYVPFIVYRANCAEQTLNLAYITKIDDNGNPIPNYFTEEEQQKLARAFDKILF